jgi:outer membrane protein assembly factor BamB
MTGLELKKTMKINRIVLIPLFLFAAVMLSSCSGVLGATSWPGLTSADETVYVSYATEVYALNAGNGSIIWQYPQEANAQRNFFAPAAVNEDHIYVGDYSNTLVALDRATGTEEWTFTEGSGRFIASPLLTDDLVVVPSSGRRVYALTKSGQKAWDFATAQGSWAVPVSDGEVVYQPSMDHFLYAIRQDNGALVWKTDIGAAAVSSPALVDGRLYLGTLANEVIAVDAATGAIDWHFSADNAIWNQPFFHEGTLYFGDLSGSVFAVDADDGSVVWRKTVEGSVVAEPVFVDDMLVFVTETGNVTAMSLEGNNLWTVNINGKLYSSPEVVDNRIIVGVVDGENQLVVALDLSGSVLWSFAPSK